MDTRNIDQKLTMLQTGISDLETHLSKMSDEESGANLEELMTNLEELHVAEEELHFQNAQLRDTQKSLEREREKYSKLFALSPDGHVLTNAKGDIIEANLAFAALVNFSTDFLLNQPLRDLVIESQQVRFDEVVQQPAQMVTFNQEVSLQPRVGKPIPTEMSMTPIAAEGNESRYLLWIYHDMRDRQQAAKMESENTRLQEQIDAQKLRAVLEAEKAVSALKSDVMTIISHEFRTPLAIIQLTASNVESYTNMMTAEKRAQKFNIIYGQISRLANMLDDISLVVNGVSNISALTLMPLNIQTYCENLIHDIQAAFAQSHVISFELDSVITHVSADQYLLDLILRGLIQNALVYSDKGSQVKLLASRVENDLLFHVVDQGIGIPLQDQSMIFKTIHRGSNVSNRQGLGLGLKIVQECTDLYGGSISFVSEENKGSTFSVRLPAFHS